MTYEDGEESYEVTSGDKETARLIYRAAVETHHQSDENVDDIHDDFDEGIARAYKNGDIIVRTEKLLAAHLWQVVSSESGQHTRQLAKDLVEGRTSMPVEDWLDTVIMCGKSRRTTRRHMVPKDWDRIVNVREDNATRATLALKDAREAAAIGLAIFAKHGSMQSAADAGDLPLAFSDESE